MPYVPSEKTNPPAQDRSIIDAALEPLILDIASRVERNMDLLRAYKAAFIEIADAIGAAFTGTERPKAETPAARLGLTIYEVGRGWNYDGAHEGELNYAITMLLQLLPQKMVGRGKWKESDELRYWLEGVNFHACLFAALKIIDRDDGVSGVYLDIALEHKGRMNLPYEIFQILKSGDCYIGPYYNRVVEIRDEGSGELVGYQLINMKRSEATLRKDKLDGYLVFRRTSPCASSGGLFGFFRRLLRNR